MNDNDRIDWVNGIWEDGEWTSWELIDECVESRPPLEYTPPAGLQEIFVDLVEIAKRYYQLTGRHLPVFGELGELYGEIEYGIKRHKPNTPGSDGRLGNDFVEIKTISPQKSANTVSVKRAGNFNKLLIVKINEDFEFQAKLIDRKMLGKGKGKYTKVLWRSVED